MRADDLNPMLKQFFKTDALGNLTSTLEDSNGNPIPVMGLGLHFDGYGEVRHLCISSANGVKESSWTDLFDRYQERGVPERFFNRFRDGVENGVPLSFSTLSGGRIALEGGNVIPFAGTAPGADAESDYQVMPWMNRSATLAQLQSGFTALDCPLRAVAGTGFESQTMKWGGAKAPPFSRNRLCVRKSSDDWDLGAKYNSYFSTWAALGGSTSAPPTAFEDIFDSTGLGMDLLERVQSYAEWASGKLGLLSYMPSGCKVVGLVFGGRGLQMQPTTSAEAMADASIPGTDIPVWDSQSGIVGLSYGANMTSQIYSGSLRFTTNSYYSPTSYIAGNNGILSTACASAAELSLRGAFRPGWYDDTALGSRGMSGAWVSSDGWLMTPWNFSLYARTSDRNHVLTQLRNGTTLVSLPAVDLTGHGISLVSVVVEIGAPIDADMPLFVDMSEYSWGDLDLNPEVPTMVFTHNPFSKSYNSGGGVTQGGCTYAHLAREAPSTSQITLGFSDTYIGPRFMGLVPIRATGDYRMAARMDGSYPSLANPTASFCYPGSVSRVGRNTGTLSSDPTVYQSGFSVYTASEVGLPVDAGVVHVVQVGEMTSLGGVVVPSAYTRGNVRYASKEACDSDTSCYFLASTSTVASESTTIRFGPLKDGLIRQWGTDAGEQLYDTLYSLFISSNYNYGDSFGDATLLATERGQALPSMKVLTLPRVPCNIRLILSDFSTSQGTLENGHPYTLINAYVSECQGMFRMKDFVDLLSSEEEVLAPLMGDSLANANQLVEDDPDQTLRYCWTSSRATNVYDDLLVSTVFYRDMRKADWSLDNEMIPADPSTNTAARSFRSVNNRAVGALTAGSGQMLATVTTESLESASFTMGSYLSTYLSEGYRIRLLPYVIKKGVVDYDAAGIASADRTAVPYLVSFGGTLGQGLSAPTMLWVLPCLVSPSGNIDLPFIDQFFGWDVRLNALDQDTMNVLLPKMEDLAETIAMLLVRGMEVEVSAAVVGGDEYSAAVLETQFWKLLFGDIRTASALLEAFPSLTNDGGFSESADKYDMNISNLIPGVYPDIRGLSKDVASRAYFMLKGALPKEVEKLAYTFMVHSA